MMGCQLLRLWALAGFQVIHPLGIKRCHNVIEKWVQPMTTMDLWCRSFHRYQVAYVRGWRGATLFFCSLQMDFTTQDGLDSTTDSQDSTTDSQDSSPDGQCSTPDGQRSTPDGQRSTPDGQRSTPDGQSSTLGVQVLAPDGQIFAPGEIMRVDYVGQGNPSNGDESSPEVSIKTRNHVKRQQVCGFLMLIGLQSSRMDFMLRLANCIARHQMWLILTNSTSDKADMLIWFREDWDCRKALFLTIYQCHMNPLRMWCNPIFVKRGGTIMNIYVSENQNFEALSYSFMIGCNPILGQGTGTRGATLVPLNWLKLGLHPWSP